MKSPFSSLIVSLAVVLILTACENKPVSDKIPEPFRKPVDRPTKDTLALSDSAKRVQAPKDSLTVLLEKLRKTPHGKRYMVKGDLKTDILTYKSMEFGDLLHLGFVDAKGKEYDFNNNSTDIDLYDAVENPGEGEAYEQPKKKYLNKKFRVVWRTLKLKGKPKDDMEWYYDEYDEIIYLKQLGK